MDTGSGIDTGDTGNEGGDGSGDVSGFGEIGRDHPGDEVGFFDVALQCADDWDMWLRIASRFEFDFIAEPFD